MPSFQDFCLANAIFCILFCILGVNMIRQINQERGTCTMNNSFNQLLNNTNHRSPADGTGGVRRSPADGTGGVRRSPADGTGGVR